MPGPEHDKLAAREALRAIRTGLPDSYLRDASARICDRLMSLEELSGSGDVHCFWPRNGTSEVDIRPVIRFLIGAGRSVYLPVVVQHTRRSANGPRILEAPLIDEKAMDAGPWGILQPDAQAARRLRCDVAIIPGLGVGRNATRVGHGWGFYDELLSQSGPAVVLPCFDACVLDSIAASDHDVPADIVVTETRVLRNHGGKLV